jgi:hypothetical protein
MTGRHEVAEVVVRSNPIDMVNLEIYVPGNRHLAPVAWVSASTDGGHENEAVFVLSTDGAITVAGDPRHGCPGVVWIAGSSPS